MYIKNPEYFITTVREGSISKAAEKLYLSQPYLSQCIARTEGRKNLYALSGKCRSPDRAV